MHLYTRVGRESRVVQICPSGQSTSGGFFFVLSARHQVCCGATAGRPQGPCFRHVMYSRSSRLAVFGIFATLHALTRTFIDTRVSAMPGQLSSIRDATRRINAENARESRLSSSHISVCRQRSSNYRSTQGRTKA